MSKTFKDLVVWQKAHQLVILVYRYTKVFPVEERYGLISDMRRASISVPTNIVEGFGRKGFKDSLNFFNRSEASLEELKYQTLLSLDLGYIDQKIFYELDSIEKEVGRLLNGWMKSYRPLKVTYT